MTGAPARWASPSRSTLVTPGVQEQTQISARRRKRRKPPRLRVNVHKPSELLAWANYWGCTQQKCSRMK